MSKSKVNFGVIGAGGIAFRKTIPGMLKAKNCRLVAVMDPVDIDRIAGELNVKAAYKSEADLLADPAVDAVYIASPVSCHARQIKMAAVAGKHVLCEKPLTLKLKQAQEAVEVCKKNKVLLQEGYMMKFHGAHVKMKELIDQGRLGKIVYMRAQLSCWYPKMEGAWRQDPRTGGGGALIDMASHLFDLLEHFAGPIRRIATLTGRQVQDYRSEDSSATLLEFKSGAQATVDSYFCIPDEAARTRLEVYGSQGAILTEGTIGQSKAGKMEGVFGLGDSGYDAAQNKDVQRKFTRVPFEKIDPYTAECDYFADCILNRRQPKINGAKNALHLMGLIENAYASAKQHAMLKV